MSENISKNPCVESGCLGGCCQDITLYESEDTILNTFPMAVEVNAYQLKHAILKKLDGGVYYQYDGRNPEPGMVIARIVGACPNLKQNGNCAIHDRCSRAAVKFEIGSKDCNNIRKDMGLSEI